MKILVCVKQVPDMESKFKLDKENKWFSEEDLAFRMNEYDEYAVEQAVQLKEQTGDAEAVVVSLGPERAKEAVKKALAMGCDRAIHIKDDNYYKKDSYSVAKNIFEYVKDENFDIVFTGLQSQDRGSAQVGVLLSEFLDYPCITTIIELEYNNSEIQVKRELEGGEKAVVKVKPPVVLTCQLGLNTPRYPTLPNIMKAKKKEIKAVEPLDTENLLTFADIDYPEKKGAAEILEGDVNELVDKTLEILKQKTSVLK
ncbi:MAG: electron transfer flavoprotein subunit beta/FixA family protein [Flexistipes sinusarabici]|uniref:Electron transfer flavoprotein subunit beta n=1 Tax=Flexistipes sinusarabici TaxID=2352 RepID=A0A5D0MNW9_FLESI|nr:electron transfer flavoprotein subunit beta/FixA family protein [Flexistipes sinusarabici]TYB34726.1 MAG: electron transfer flavoprotein subunit beta/FixA family protein [Flexistipes sinusarabici]